MIELPDENNGPWNTFPLRMSISSMHTKKKSGKVYHFTKLENLKYEDIRQVLP